jgi:hypothetical protein
VRSGSDERAVRARCVQRESNPASRAQRGTSEHVWVRFDSRPVHLLEEPHRGVTSPRIPVRGDVYKGDGCRDEATSTGRTVATVCTAATGHCPGVVFVLAHQQSLWHPASSR